MRHGARARAARCIDPGPRPTAIAAVPWFSLLQIHLGPWRGGDAAVGAAFAWIGLVFALSALLVAADCRRRSGVSFRPGCRGSTATLLVVWFLLMMAAPTPRSRVIPFLLAIPVLMAVYAVWAKSPALRKAWPDPGATRIVWGLAGLTMLAPSRDGRGRVAPPSSP